MSLSTCEICGGHIPLGPDASNRCEKCGAHVFAGLPRMSPMTDNASIVREALHHMAAAMEVYGPAPVAVKTPLEDRPVYGLYPFKALTALETELATAKAREAGLTSALAEVQADLERAREAIKRGLPVLDEAMTLLSWCKHDMYPKGLGDYNGKIPCCQEDGEVALALFRAALAPEQKGHSETTRL